MVTISVLMAVHNGERYLRPAIQSILSQTLPDFEFLILDDGSVDSTLSILKECAAQDRRVRVFSRENRGLPASLNELLAHAQGEFIARMDGDDIASPSRFSQQVLFLREHADVVCVGGSVVLIDQKGRHLTTIPYAESDEDIQDRILSGYTEISHPAAMMRRSALVRVGGYDETLFLAEDLDLWLKLGEIGKLANLPDVVLRYRVHSASVSAQASVRQMQVARTACERAWKRRGMQRQFEQRAAWRPYDAQSQREFLLGFGWWAWHSAQHRTAATYALHVIRESPTWHAGWVLLACVLCRPLRTVLDSLRSRMPERSG